MSLKLSPKAKRNIGRIIPFGVIWLVVGWYDLFIDAVATGNQNLNPSTDITMTFEVFVFASFAVTIVGLLVGTIEVLWLGNLFVNRPFWQKISYKTAFYAFFLTIVILTTYPIAAGIELGTSPLAEGVRVKLQNFVFSYEFLNTLVSIGFSLFLSLFYAGISENVGQKVLSNFFSGRYHSPQEEERIFMFLDMRSSTALAEQLGHIKYFELLREYYNDLSDAIVDHRGEVYQYVGDEVVISWESPVGLKNSNCIHCFFAMKDAMESRKSHYNKKYGTSPTFKAGIHCGKVTAGEIGALKKEIFFTGDVLNVTARIQGMCNQYGQDLLISDDLLKQLNANGLVTQSLGTIHLKGREKELELFSVQN